MKRIESVSDDEIRSLMNFDEVLLKRNKIIRGGSSAIAKWSIAGIVIVGALLYFLIDSPSDNVTSHRAPETSTKNSGSKDSVIVLKPVIATPSRDSWRASSSARVEERPVQQKQRIDQAPATTPTETTHAYVPSEPVQGYDHLYQYFTDNLRYPPEALKDSVQGVLTVSFTINEEGNPERVAVSNSLGEAFEAEAIRLIEGMPDWKPAILDGAPVKSKITLPLTFRIRRIKAPASQ